MKWLVEGWWLALYLMKKLVRRTQAIASDSLSRPDREAISVPGGAGRIVALFIWARYYRFRLHKLFHQILVPARRAFFWYRLVGGGEFAFRIIATAVESVSLTRFLFDQFAVGANRTFHPYESLFDIFAFRIATTGCELAKTAVANHHIASTLGAKFIQWNIGNFLPLIETPRRFAIRITGASHELPEASALQDHYPAAILTILFLRGLLNVSGIEIGKIDRVFFRKRAAFGILFVVGAACVKRTVLSPLNHEGKSTAFALLVGWLLHPLHVFHVLFSVAEVFLELFIEVGESVRPFLGAVFNLI